MPQTAENIVIGGGKEKISKKQRKIMEKEARKREKIEKKKKIKEKRKFEVIEGGAEKTSEQIESKKEEFKKKGQDTLETLVTALGGTESEIKANINEGERRLEPVQNEVAEAAQTAEQEIKTLAPAGLYPKERESQVAVDLISRAREAQQKAIAEKKAKAEAEDLTLPEEMILGERAAKGKAAEEKKLGKTEKEKIRELTGRANEQYTQLMEARNKFAQLDRKKPKTEEEKANWQKGLDQYNQSLHERRKVLLDLMKDKFERKGWSEEKKNEQLKKYEESIIKSTIYSESIRIADLKTKLNLEEQGKSKFTELKNYALKAVENYRKMSLKKKLVLSGALLVAGVGAGYVGGAAGAAMITGVAVGRWYQRLLGAGATTVAVEAGMKKWQEKRLKLKTLKLADNLEEKILNNSEELDNKIKELGETRKTQELIRGGVALGLGVFVASGYLGKLLTKAYGGIENLVHPGPLPGGVAKEVSAGLAQGVEAKPAVPVSVAPEAAISEAPKVEIFTAHRGDSVWRLTREYLEKNYADKFANLPRAQQDHIINDIKNNIRSHHQEYGLKHSLQLRVGQEVDFSHSKDYVNGLFEGEQPHQGGGGRIVGAAVHHGRKILPVTEPTPASVTEPLFQTPIEPGKFAGQVENRLGQVPQQAYKVPPSGEPPHGGPSGPVEVPPPGQPPVPPGGEAPPPPPAQPGAPGHPTIGGAIEPGHVEPEPAHPEQPTGHTLTAQEIADQKRKALELRQQQRLDQLRKQGKIPKKAPAGWGQTQAVPESQLTRPAGPSSPPEHGAPPSAAHIEQAPPPAPPAHIEESAAPEAVPHKVEATPEQRATVKKVYKVLKGDESLETKNKKINKILGPPVARGVMRVYANGKIMDKRINAEGEIFKAIFKKK